MKTRDTSRPLTLAVAAWLAALPLWAADDAPPAAPADAATPAVSTNAPAGDKPLRLNFRGVPLEMVLNYLSEAAGYIIVLETDVRGKVDVWSNQPVTQEEAFTILDGVLSRNGYSALRNGRTLTIVSKESARKRDIPVKSGNDPEEIPKNEEMVTQIIPVRFINAAQLTQNLTPLLPSEASLTANEAGNALIITDSQASIRRLTEIVRALDTSMAGSTTVKVFPLKYSDAKELATVIKELFPAQPTTPTGGGGGGRFGGFGGFGGGGGGGGSGSSSTSASNARANASRVVAVADEHSNSVVVNAPEDVLPSIEELIKSVDTSVQDVTELRVFHLRHADPVEMSEVLAGLFPDETQSSSTSQRGQQTRFGGGPFGGFGGFNGGGRRTQSQASSESDRAKKKGRVIAIPDQRTSSVIVSADREMMGQIGEMIAQLDASPAKKQKVFVYDLQNADPQQVQEVLRNLFENQQTANRNQRSTLNQQGSALLNRSTQQQQNFNRNTGQGGGFGGQGGGGGFGRGN